MHYNKLTAVKGLVLMLVGASERQECLMVTPIKEETSLWGGGDLGREEMDPLPTSSVARRNRCEEQ